MRQTLQCYEDSHICALFTKKACDGMSLLSKTQITSYPTSKEWKCWFAFLNSFKEMHIILMTSVLICLLDYIGGWREKGLYYRKGTSWSVIWVSLFTALNSESRRVIKDSGLGFVPRLSPFPGRGWLWKVRNKYKVFRDWIISDHWMIMLGFWKTFVKKSKSM